MAEVPVCPLLTRRYLVFMKCVGNESQLGLRLCSGLRGVRAVPNFEVANPPSQLCPLSIQVAILPERATSPSTIRAEHPPAGT